MTRHEFIIKTIIAMAANSSYRYSWHGRDAWATEIIAAAITLADHMEKKGLLNNPEVADDG